MEKYREILEILVRDQDYVKYALDRLKDVATNPENYEDAFFRLPSINSDLVWLQFTDDLLENNYAFEVDWKENYTEVKKQIENSFRKKGISKTIERDNYLFDLEAKDYFPKVNQLLSETTFSLMYVDIDSDSYVTVLIFKSEIKILQSLDERIKLY
ncbi:DUF6630 family protein [Chryseobacterium vrystaatense]|uniref:DUF6630 domain-containing protein n=1 Tax=Chryseobacterium vrystaatense TaxID=307480 RepID=A0A1M5NVJ7_9FLAO|nr:DUF6630 family protein [Chryseobacterium vrystaatense]SHG93209.1 hypothetical protein SAMN02787073_5085 [Chryseobacterium vrystaatense]